MTALLAVLIKNGWLDWFWISNPMLVQYWSKVDPIQRSDNIRLEILCPWWEHCKDISHILTQVLQVLELERFVFKSHRLQPDNILVVIWANRAVIVYIQIPWNIYKDPSPHIELPMLPIWHSCGQLNQLSSHSLHPDTMEHIRVRIALAKSAGCLQNGSHMLLLTWTYLVSCLFCKRGKKRE